MTLQAQNVMVSLTGGLDTKDDPKKVIQGKLLVAENIVYTSPQELRKRNGFTKFTQNIQTGGGATTITSAKGIATFQSELDLFKNHSLYSWSPEQPAWAEKLFVPSVEVTSVPLSRDLQYADFAMATNGIANFAFFGTDTAGNHVVSTNTVDTSTFSIIATNTPYSSGTAAQNVRMIYFGTSLVLLITDAAGNLYTEFHNSITNPSVDSGLTTIETDVNTSHGTIDACVLNDFLYIAYNTSSSTIAVLKLDESLAVVRKVTYSGEVATNGISIFPDTTLNQVWVSYNNGSAIKAIVYDSALNISQIAFTVSTTSTANNVTGTANNGFADILYDDQSAGLTYNYFTVRYYVSNVAVVVGGATIVRSVSLVSKIARYSTSYLTLGVDFFVVLGYYSALQPTYFLVGIKSGNNSEYRIFAKLAPDQGAAAPISTSTSLTQVQSIYQPSSGVFNFILSQNNGLNTISSGVRANTQTAGNSIGTQFVTTNLPSVGALTTIQNGTNLVISGGVQFIYDGLYAVEQNFNLSTEVPTGTATTSGGHLLDNTAYTYLAVYEWVDNQGGIHRSDTSATVTKTTGNSASNVCKVTVHIPTLRVTANTNMYCSLYRQAQSSVPALYYYVGATLNSTTVDTVDVVDTLAEATLIANPQLYTTGGVSPYISPPASFFVTSYKSRVMSLPAENRQQIYFSTQTIPGTAPEFPLTFVLNVDSTGGDLTGAIQMDDKFVMFKNDFILYMTGDGPTPTGSQNDFSSSQVIASDVGCQTGQHKSIVLTGLGVIFKSLKGIYLLDRGLNTKYIGAPVEQFNSSNITSAVLIPNTTQVRFTLDDGTTALVYDYLIDQWSVFTNINAIDSLIFDNLHTYVSSTGIVSQETIGTFTDNGLPIRMNLLSSWLTFAGINGFERVKEMLVLGTYVSPHNLNVRLNYDFNPNFQQDTTILVANTFSTVPAYGGDSVYGSSTPYGGGYPNYQFRVFTQKQKCTAIQIQIQDGDLANFGEAFSISEISFEVGVKKGLNKLPASSSFG